MKEEKTNAIRRMEALGIAHEVTSYPTDGTAVDAVTMAEKLGVDPETVFKTLVTVGKSGAHYVFVVPGPASLDLKKAAKAAGEKSIAMIQVKELLPLTGYIRGGCSPIGMKKAFPTFIDETAQLFDLIYVSAGRIGTQLHLAPDLLLQAADAQYADIIE